MKLNKKQCDRLLHWIIERELIRLKKESGLPKPWTKDKILQTYRFCNVRRMDDAVSRWLLNNWYTPNFNHPMMPVAASMARFFNKPTTLEVLGFPDKWEPRRWKATLAKLRKHGPIFNAAYIIKGEPRIDKVVSVISYLKIIYNQPPDIDRSSMYNTWKVMKTYMGLGSFTAGQVTADLRWAMKGTWKDAGTFAPMGPGSQRGLNRLCGYDLHYNWNEEEFAEGLKMMMDICIASLPNNITNRLEAQDYQSCLCEFDKYMRCLCNQGKPKQLYDGLGFI